MIHGPGGDASCDHGILLAILGTMDIGSRILGGGPLAKGLLHHGVGTSGYSGIQVRGLRSGELGLLVTGKLSGLGKGTGVITLGRGISRGGVYSVVARITGAGIPGGIAIGRVNGHGITVRRVGGSRSVVLALVVDFRTAIPVRTARRGWWRVRASHKHDVCMARDRCTSSGSACGSASCSSFLFPPGRIGLEILNHSLH